MKTQWTFTSIAAVMYVSLAFGGYGDPDPSYPDMPSWEERAVIVLVNACRMDPTGFRDKYVGNVQILLPQNYPAVGPLYWNVNLNRAARDHSIDMAQNCGMQHNSCDGTPAGTRVKTYYPSYRAENIAGGYSTPMLTVVGWIKDRGTNGLPAPDKQVADSIYKSGDGHRKNIMNGSLTETGTGYAYGPQKYNHFWTQDFGNAQSPFKAHPVQGATHLQLTNGKITFMANYFEASGGSPQSAKVIVNTQEHELSILLGKASAGTYAVELPSSSGCRSYFFIFTDSNGKTWRFPESGDLITFGEGNCDQFYEPAGTTTTLQNCSHKSVPAVLFENTKISFVFDEKSSPVKTILYTLSGRKAGEYNHINMGQTVSIPTSNLNAGLFYALHIYAEGTSSVNRFIVSK